jgi:Transposase DNA-binding
MDASISLPLAVGDSRSFGHEHFGGCQFGDKRLNARAIISGNALMRHPGGTLPAKMLRGELCGFYDFANNVKVNHDNVLSGHCQRTRERMEHCRGVVLIIHDTTEGDYSGLNIADLGPIGNGGRRGLLIHNVLAMDYQNREALGLIGQVLQIRRRVEKKESVQSSREHPQRQSRLWPKGANAVGRPPEDAIWVNLMDRGGDSFESLDCQQRLGQFYVVRSHVSRKMRVRDAAGRWRNRKLHSWARHLPTLGERTVEVAGQKDQQARQARVRVAAGPVELLVPHVKYGEHGREPLAAWVIHVKELEAPQGQEPLEWILLTNRSTQTRQEAWERVDWYQCRPMVEEFHKAQKTGCGMELPQFTTRKALEVTIAMLSVVAVQLLRLRDLSRKDDQRPASQVMDEPYIEALSLWRWREARMDVSAREFLYALARLGGHLGRRGDRLPGWLVLWRGWMELQRLVEGMLLAKLKRSG